MKYYTDEDVSSHCFSDDCWVIIHNKVYNLTALLSKNRGNLADPIIKHAGKSLSHWFNVEKKTYDIELKTYVDPKRNVTLPYTPDGRFIDVPPADPTDTFEIKSLPWWKDEQYIIGQVI